MVKIQKIALERERGVDAEGLKIHEGEGNGYKLV